MKNTFLLISKIACVHIVPLCSLCACGVTSNTTKITTKETQPQEDPKLWALLDIDNGVLKGFKSDVTYNEINATKEKVLIIPKEVTEIADFAFPYLFDGVVVKNIESIDFTQATNLKRIGDKAFYWNQGLYSKSLAPSGVDLSNNIKLESIGTQAFSNCPFDGEIKLPDSLSEIGDHAFENCQSLSGSLTLPRNLQHIGDYAFKNCFKISNLNLYADKFGCVPQWAYEFTQAFKNLGSDQQEEKPTCNVELRNDTLNNWQIALYDRLLLSDSVYTISPMKTTELGCFTLDENKTEFTGFSGGETTIDKYDVFKLPNQNEDAADITSIGEEAFKGNDSHFWPQTNKLYPILFDDSSMLSKINPSSFAKAGNLTGPLVLPSNLTTLGEKAFSECINLELVDFSKINSSVSTGNGVFEKNQKLRSAVLSSKITPEVVPEQETELNNMFLDDTQLYWIDMSSFDKGTPPEKWNNNFSYSDANAYNLYPRLLLLPTGTDVSEEEWDDFLVNNYNYKNHSNLHYAILGDLTKKLEKNMLLVDLEHVIRGIEKPTEVKNVVSVTLPEDTKAIGNGVFDSIFTTTDGSIKYLLHLNEGLEKIGNDVFKDCNGLAFDFIYPNSLNWIGDGAFVGCTNMYQNFHLPQKIKHLGKHPWPEGVKMSCDGNFVIPESLEYAGGMAFGNLDIYPTSSSGTYTIVVPASLKETTSVENWGPFAGINCYQGSTSSKTSFDIDVSAFGSDIPEGWDNYSLNIKYNSSQCHILVSDDAAWEAWNTRFGDFLNTNWSFKVKGS